MDYEKGEPHSVNSENPTMIQVRFRKLFIGGVDSTLSENDIKDYFGKYGVITSCIIHRERETGRSRGFGFITFEDPTAVDAVQSRRPHIIQGCEVTLKRAVPKELFQEFDGLLTVNRMFVGGLSQETEDCDLRDYFSQFGRVRKVDVMADRHTNAKRGFAFVEFDDYDPVDKVVLQKNHVIQGQEVTVKKAKSRLEMELLKQRKGAILPDMIPPAVLSPVRRSNMYFQDSRTFIPPMAAFTRASLDSLDYYPFPYASRRRRWT